MSSLPITPSSFAQPDAHSQWVLASRIASRYFRFRSGQLVEVKIGLAVHPAHHFIFRSRALEAGSVVCVHSKRRARVFEAVEQDVGRNCS